MENNVLLLEDRFGLLPLAYKDWLVEAKGK